MIANPYSASHASVPSPAATKTLSQRLFLLEVIFIAAPYSAGYFALGAVALVLRWSELFHWTVAIPAILGVLVSASILSAWVLIGDFLRHGSVRLRARGLVWWLSLLFGVGAVAAGWISVALPSSPEYSEMWEFRGRLEVFAFGTPLLLPLLHLLTERIYGSGR